MPFPQLQSSYAYVIQPSDTVDVKDDTNNLYDSPVIFVHNPAASGLVKVLPAASKTEVPVSIYVVQGTTFPLAVRRVYNTSPTPPAGLIGLANR